MGLSNPKTIFGVQSAAPYNRSTREFYGILTVLGSSNLNFSGDVITLNGGSYRFPVAVATGLISAEIELVMREYPSFVFELFLGKAPTDASAEASGNVSSITDAYGTSVVHATTGIASVSATPGDTADLKFGKYVVKAASATTVDVYVSSNVDFQRGTDVDYVNDLLKITSSPLTIPGSGATVALADFGLTFTGGSSGTISMTTGDTATFEVRPINSKSMGVTIGSNSDSFPEFGMVVVAEKEGGHLFEVDLFRCKGVGLPIGFTEKEFSESSVTAQAFQDTTRGGVFSIRSVIEA